MIAGTVSMKRMLAAALAMLAAMALPSPAANSGWLWLALGLTALSMGLIALPGLDRVARVNCKVHDHLLDLARVGAHRREVAPRAAAEAQCGAHGPHREPAHELAAALWEAPRGEDRTEE